MGQVCGKIKNHECEWISLEEQEKRFSIHKLVDVYLGLGSENIHHELFDHQIAHLIADYAKMDDKWSKACKLLGQDKVPAFPEEHISEIGDRDSVFYLTPAGSLNEFSHKIERYAYDVLGINFIVNPLIIRYWTPVYHDDSYFNAPQDAKWVSMKRDVLQGSRNKTYEEQKELAKKEAVTIPSIQTVAKILLLDNAVQLSNAVQNHRKQRCLKNIKHPDKIARKIKQPLFHSHLISGQPNATCTRVKEKTGWDRLYIGIRDSSLCIDISATNREGGDIGLAVLREF